MCSQPEPLLLLSPATRAARSLSRGDAFYNLALDKTIGDLTLADEMNIANTLDFQAADNYIVLDNNLQVLHITGYDATRHVRAAPNGLLVRTVLRYPVDFSLATPPTTRPHSNAGASDLYFVRVADAVPPDGDAGAPLTADADRPGLSKKRRSPRRLRLDAEVQRNGEELTGFDHTASYVSHYTGGSWDAQPVVSATGADPYTLTRTGIATLSPFAVFGGGFVPVIDISGIILWEHDGVREAKCQCRPHR
ncbi:MAG: hypothetical protein R2791_14910 [Saprospiraceae bacterium]